MHLEATLAQELFAGSFMKQVSMAEQQHTSLRSPCTKPNVGRSGVKLAAIGLWSSGNAFSGGMNHASPSGSPTGQIWVWQMPGDRHHINAHDFGMRCLRSRCPYTFGHVVQLCLRLSLCLHCKTSNLKSSQTVQSEPFGYRCFNFPGKNLPYLS